MKLKEIKKHIPLNGSGNYINAVSDFSKGNGVSISYHIESKIYYVYVENEHNHVKFTYRISGFSEMKKYMKKYFPDREDQLKIQKALLEVL